MPEVSGDLITRNYSNFRGVDFSNTEVALYRSPDAINMWKDYKKMGTSIETRPDIVLFKELKNTVYGLFFYTINQVDHMIIHCGVSLYDYNMKTKELKIIKEKGMNIRKSQSFIYRNILYIKDGLNYLQYDGETCKEVIGYIPTTTIGKAPSGGGTTNQEVNLLTGVRENSFCADGESTEYVLDASELDAGYQEKVFINDVEKTEGFTVDKVSGKVKFTTAPEKPLTDGQDNVVIRFSKTIPGNRDKINKCTILEVFDNRVFFSGNQDYPNTVFHTMLDEPKYCSDLDYYNEGADISPVRGMVAGNNALWVIKEPSQANTAIFYHNPTIDSEAGKVYPSEHSSISTGCIGAAINFNDDIVYFSNRGMEGISGDITTEQVISHRSSLVDSKLLQEENYKDMILVEYEGYLLVIIKDKIYLADSRAMFTNENHNEYEWFYWNIDIEPTCAVVYNGELWLGSKQGIFKIGKASENNKEISMKKDEEERYFIDGVTKQETGAESYKTVTGKEILIEDGENNKGLEIKVKGESTQNGTPTPDSPIEIENIEGKNLFDGNKSEWGKYNVWQHNTGNYANAFVNVINIKGLDKCSISFKNNTRTFRFGYQFIDDNENYLSGLYWSTFTNEKIVANISVPENASKIIISQLDGQKEDDIKIQLEKGTVATPYVPYNSLEFKDEGKNKFNVQDTNNVTEGITVDNEGWLTVTGDNTDGTATKFFNYYTNNLNLKTGTNYNVIAEVKNVSGTGSVNFVSVNKAAKQFQSIFNKNFSVLANNTVYNSINKTIDEFVGNSGLRTYISFAAGQSGSITFRLSVLEDTTITAENFEYEEYKSQVATFPLEGQKLMEGSYLADDGTHHKRKQVVLDGSREYIRYTSLDSANYNCFYTNQSDIYVDSTGTQTCLMSNYFKGDKFDNRALDIPNMWVNKFSSQIYFKVPNTITTVEELTTLFAEQYANGTPVIVEYELAEEETVPYTETQQEAREKLRHFKGLNGENNITAQGTMTSTLDLTLYNVAEEDFDIYISKKGYFGALKYDINNLIDFMESNIPSIAEATESSVKIAGRDGDISLNTVYEPLPFEIVCYTEDNLTPEEKIIEEQKITSLLNSIKNQTKTLFMEREKKFYKVKYSGNLSVVRYPKHLKFTIPLKSSESYAMNFEESEIIGNGTKVSNTIKDTGAIFTIKGPATKPIISLNNYQMKYNENILEGNSLIINSEDSTITHITSAGVKTNAMRAYNHEFPKIKNGENQLAVSSGIDDEKQVNVKWYDLKI